MNTVLSSFLKRIHFNFQKKFLTIQNPKKYYKIIIKEVKTCQT